MNLGVSNSTEEVHCLRVAPMAMLDAQARSAIARRSQLSVTN